VRTLSQNLGGETPAASLTAYTAADTRRVPVPCSVRELVGVVAILALKEQPSGRLVD